MVQSLSSWFQTPAVMWGLGIFSLVAALASIVLVPRFLATLPPNYLQTEQSPGQQHFLWRIVRNLLGAALALLGVLLLVLPGQGLLTLLAGLVLLDFPGKQRIIRGVLGRPKVLVVVNKLRSRRGSPPLLP